MLLGRYPRNLDYKGRIAIPKRFRDELKATCILTRGLDGCLFLYPQSQWQSLGSRLESLPLTASDARSFSRYIFSSAVEVSFDKLGRITVPDHLISFAGLKKEVLVLGVSNRLEIWAEKNWEIYNKKVEAKSEDIAEKLTGSGI